MKGHRDPLVPHLLFVGAWTVAHPLPADLATALEGAGVVGGRPLGGAAGSRAILCPRVEAAAAG